MGAGRDREIRFLPPWTAAQQREIRGELFDEAFQQKLAAAYKPRGQEPVPPALLAMVLLLQA